MNSIPRVSNEAYDVLKILFPFSKLLILEGEKIILREQLMNDEPYVTIGQILTELHITEHTRVGTHRHKKMLNYLLFIDILE